MGLQRSRATVLTIPHNLDRNTSMILPMQFSSHVGSNLLVPCELTITEIHRQVSSFVEIHCISPSQWTKKDYGHIINPNCPISFFLMTNFPTTYFRMHVSRATWCFFPYFPASKEA